MMLMGIMQYFKECQALIFHIFRITLCSSWVSQQESCCLIFHQAQQHRSLWCLLSKSPSSFLPPLSPTICFLSALWFQLVNMVQDSESKVTVFQASKDDPPTLHTHKHGGKKTAFLSVQSVCSHHVWIDSRCLDVVICENEESVGSCEFQREGEQKNKLFFSSSFLLAGAEIALRPHLMGGWWVERKWDCWGRLMMMMRRRGWGKLRRTPGPQSGYKTMWLMWRQIRFWGRSDPLC